MVFDMAGGWLESTQSNLVPASFSVGQSDSRLTSNYWKNI